MEVKKMNIFKKLYYDIRYKIQDSIMKHKYPDWEDNEYNFDNLKFIWGIKSWDDLSSCDANLYTMNDIEILYDRDTKEYALDIETIYQFKDGKDGEVKYLDGLLNAFTKYMEENNLDMDEPFGFWNCQPNNFWRAKSIPELYTSFRLFVEGYKSLYFK